MTQEKRDKIIHAQLGFSLAYSVLRFFAEQFQHHISDLSRFQLNSDIKHINKTARRMEKTLGVKDRLDTEEVVMDAEDFISSGINAINVALLKGKKEEVQEFFDKFLKENK